MDDYENSVAVKDIGFCREKTRELEFLQDVDSR